MIKITKDNINAISLDKYRTRSSIDHNEFHELAGNQHYKLLAHLSTLFNNSIIFDIGTHRGASATALSYNQSNTIYSFDIEDRIGLQANSPKEIKNINFIQENLFSEKTRESWKDKILKSSLIFLDIDPHDGILEYDFYLWLKRNKYQGLLIFDDISYFEGMKKNLWTKIEDQHKEDITHLGHWSGTGAVQFNKSIEFEKPSEAKKMKVMAVTGFIPNAFPAKHLSEQQCREYGNKIKQAIPGRIHAFDEGWKLSDCWAHKFYQDNPLLMPSDISPPADRYMEPQHEALSNIVLLQRYEWMRLAAELNPDVDVFAWIEYTVFKQRNVTEDVIKNFMNTLETKYFDAVSLPGCWNKGPINDSHAHWRFCGSAWACPRQYIEKVAEAVKTVATLRTKMNGKISWDMNTMAYVELLDVLPIRWYQGNHDETQFTNF